MDSGRFVLAVILMIAVVVLTNVLFPPVSRKKTPAARDTASAVQSRSNAPAPAAAATATRPAAVAPTQPGASLHADTVVIESPIYRFGISTVGAAIVSAEMLEWKSFTREGPVQLAPRHARGLLSYRVQFGNDQVDLSTLAFTPSTKYMRLNKGGAPASVRFMHASAAGTIEVTYQFTPDNYLARATINVHGTNQAPSRLLVDFGPKLAINEARAVEDERALAYVVNNQAQGVHTYPLRSVRADRIEEGPLDWVALKNKYFVAAALIDDKAGAKPFGGVLAQPREERDAANITATLPPENGTSFSYRLYLGPQEFDRLNGIGHGFQNVNAYGWRVLRPIIRPLGHFLTWAVLSLHDAIGLTYGWILVIFGVGIRLLMWPLNKKAMRAQLKNMEMQPRIKELQAKYKSQPEVLQREMLRIYKEEGANPMGGCLPMLIPFPVLITLFFVFQSTIQFRGVPFLWLPDLSRPDPFYILPVVLGATMLLQQWMSMKTSPPNPQMKFMLWFMPAFMMIIFFNLASGLNLYYSAQNIPGFFQQMQLTKERQRHQATQAAKK
ncbi:MAG TPA: membrane protein insertase YidC [Longimicrobiales bacterium]